LRTALLAALRRDDTGSIRALLPLAGRTVLGRQIDFALSLGCERIICLAEQAAPEILTLQREVERSGVQFHLVRSNAQMVALLRSDDQLVLLLDGLVIDPGDKALIEEGRGGLRPAVLTMPSDAQTAMDAPEDFERIDAQRSWAGIAVITANTAAKLADFPPDTEAMSLLLRLGLQDAVPCRKVDPDWLAASGLLLASSREALNSRQKALFKRHRAAIVWSAPFAALAQGIAAMTAARQRAAPIEAVLAAALAFWAASALLLWFEQSGAALASGALAALIAQCAAAMSSLRTRLAAPVKPSIVVEQIPSAVDGAALAVLTGALAVSGPAIEVLALPAFAIGLARLASVNAGQTASAFWQDRVLHLVVFAGAATAGLLAPVLTVFGIGALLYKLLQERKK
jgi:hypothetical protein